MMKQEPLERFGVLEETFPSKSVPGTKHIVIVQDGVLWCSCPGYQFHSKCRHIDEVMAESIYSTVDPKDIETVPDDDRLKILTLLQDNKDQWYTAQDIAEQCDYPKNPTSIEVRKSITYLLEIDLIPIISGSKGFKYAQSPEELEAYINSLQGRVNGIMRRIVALKRIIGRS